MTKFPSYTVGTVSIDAGATVVAGAGGPLWTSTTNVRPGDDLVVAGHIVIIEDVTDDDHLEIDAWSFPAVPAGTPYKIVQRSPLRFSGAEASADVIKLVGALNTEGLPFIVAPGVAAPDPSLGEENQFAIQPSTFKLWLKTGGAWIFQGSYKGLNLRGVWDSAANYGSGDVVSRNGSAYVATATNTNTPPETSPTVWQLLASKGDKGDKGDQGDHGIDGIDGAGYAATSATSLLIGNGSKTFATQVGLAYSVGARARASSIANATNYMEGLVTAYAGASLTINVSKTGGAGTFADWNINVAGDPGSGDLLSTNNLSDVANKKTALDTLSVHGADIAAAATLNLESATGNFVHVTGSTAITAITLSDGHQRTVYFTGAPLLTNGASLVLLGAMNVQAAPGDIAVFVADGAVVRCSDYLPATQANARALIGAAASPSSRTRTTLLNGSGTYVTPAGCKAINVRIVGGGGGGGGTTAQGAQGGSSMFGALIAGGGGYGGSGGAPAGTPGASSGGDINVNGGYGFDGTATGGAIQLPQSPPGLPGPFGGGGGLGGWVGGLGTAGQANSGAGGGGCGGASAGTGGMGGGPGGYVEKFIANPAASYAFAIGAGGGGGANNGSAGGSGVIIIDEFY